MHTLWETLSLLCKFVVQTENLDCVPLGESSLSIYSVCVCVCVCVCVFTVFIYFPSLCILRDQLLASDVITGFHVEDFGQHTLVLEGMKEGGIAKLWEACPRHHSQHPGIVKVFYNSKFEFSERLYGSLDVDLPKITLSRPLKEILVQPFVYLQGSIPKECLK